MDAPSKLGRRLPDSVHCATEVLDQVLDVVGTPVRELSLGKRPDAFVGVQLGRVGWEVLDPQARMLFDKIRDRSALVYSTVVKKRYDGAAEVAEQVAQEYADLHVPDVVQEEEVVETEPLLDRADGDSGDDGYPIAAIRVLDPRRFPTRSPGARHVRDQKESGFVAEDEVGAQPRGVFFTLGHSSVFQRSISLSPSRSVARLTGFCGLQSRLCMRRPTWSG